MTDLLCSRCFTDHGLAYDAIQLGVVNDYPCPTCGRVDGSKLDKPTIERLAYRFFVRGTLLRLTYGGAPLVQFNEHRYGHNDIGVSAWLVRDLELISETLHVGFFPYGPRLWMVGEVEPLKALQDPTTRDSIVKRIITEFPTVTLSPQDTFFRLRVNPAVPSLPAEYDSPPLRAQGAGRLDSPTRHVLYASQDIEVCIHECRATVDDDLFLGTLKPTRDLTLLDLTTVLPEDTTEFESLDMAVQMLFFAGAHSYDICRAIADSVRHAGLHGIAYPSYFSFLRTGAMPFETAYGISIRRFPTAGPYARSQVIPNLALFGRPLVDGLVDVVCMNRLVLQSASYNIHFGPVQY